MSDFDLALVMRGYRQGYFLMADEHTGTLGWYRSRERALIPLDERFHCPRSLKRKFSQFTVQVNQDFAGVVAGCADRPETWISQELQQLYAQLHRAGYAHSWETWQEGALAGGILGIVVGAAFIGESMFHRVTDASKVALVTLVQHLRQQGFRLFDAQLMNPHLARFGAHAITDREYRRLLAQAVRHAERGFGTPQPP
ncbi:leucyl/phenylalanyl-tRNA--protein transferase [Gloeomargarita lithophora Alchichica-D10]|uniref:Leucyl/phenylalanyl-tRNA--protein transferase n=1 Tax=Gloeomargarita lithophora Alchichica-D10 TaxID=1188229 RepID=A0A1J0AER8_9CYAN|nr:leucyl/phenylalanyl-tRNA--protein transferase [Gloeomargarita lithophora]APB34438.1 leucyl/phenylalanyl-tRNA--protein transferase [Gloeomargarita lithophora Alchichica-D10]